MKITNAYQAILAKLGGNNDVNIPAPRNKYEKLLNDISENGGSSGGSTETVIADTQTVVGADYGSFDVVPNGSYSGYGYDYLGKTVVVEATPDEPDDEGTYETFIFKGVVDASDDYYGAHFSFATRTWGDESEPYSISGTLMLDSGSTGLMFKCQEFNGSRVTLKVTVINTNFRTVYIGEYGDVYASWGDIGSWLMNGIPVYAHSKGSDRGAYLVTSAYVDSGIYKVKIGDNTYSATNPDGIMHKVDAEV